MKQIIGVVLGVIMVLVCCTGCLEHASPETPEHPLHNNKEPIAIIAVSGLLSSSSYLNESIDGVAYAGDPIEFDATESVDPDGNIISYQWICYDNSVENSSTMSQQFTYDFSDSVSLPQLYSYTLQIEDSNHTFAYATYTLGILPKTLILYLGSEHLHREVPSSHHDQLTATLGSLRGINTLRYDVSPALTIPSCQWNATISVSKPLVGYIKTITLTLHDSTGTAIAEASQTGTLFDFQREKSYQFSGRLGSETALHALSIKITGFTLRNRITINYGGSSASQFMCDFT